MTDGQLLEDYLSRRDEAALAAIVHRHGPMVYGCHLTPSSGNRPAEFAESGPIPKEELLLTLAAVVDEARAVLVRQMARQLPEARRIQGFDLTGLAAIFDSVPHFRGHTQEIVHMTQLQLGDAYQFAWTPTTPEAGALA